MRTKNFKEFINESTEISNVDLYKEQIAAGKSEKEAVEFLLDILSNGTWAAWDQEKNR
jgi:hypothetical protein